MKERLGLTVDQKDTYAALPLNLLQEVVRQLTTTLDAEMMTELVKNFNQMKSMLGNDNNIPDISQVLESLNNLNNNQPDLQM